MSLRGVRVVGRRFVIARFVVLGGFAVVPGRVFVVFGRFLMVLCRLLGHASSLFLPSRFGGADRDTNPGL
jgi:hypothetical protein